LRTLAPLGLAALGTPGLRVIGTRFMNGRMDRWCRLLGVGPRECEKGNGEKRMDGGFHDIPGFVEPSHGRIAV
jgi:hypothetical protein